MRSSRVTSLRLWTYQTGTWNPAPGSPLLPPGAFDQTGSLTEWVYDTPTGLLKEKKYADLKKTLYSYWRDGSIYVRQWARVSPTVTTTYRWTLLGELQQMDYSDATPDVSFTWNAHNGSQATMTDTLGTHTYAVRTDGLLESETISTADGAALIDPGWDTYRRRQTLVASYAGAATGQETRHYSTQGRLTYLVSDGRTTEYRYHPSTNRVQKRLSWSGAYPAALTQVAETVETLDSMNRIWVMTNRRSDAMGAPVFSSHTYSFDNANRRELAVREDGTRWDYDYNDRSEVSAAKRQLGNGTLLAGTESTYEYDAIGNRTVSASGGGPAVTSDGTANVKRSTVYLANEVNHYTSMAQSARSFDVAGRYVYDPAAGGSSPQVNGIAPWEQTISIGAGGTQLKHFRTSLTAAASGDATGNYENVNVFTAAGTVLEYSGLKWVPKATVEPTCDFEGNLLTDGRWTYTWDAENRLKSMSHSGSVTPYVPGLLVEFRYDGLSRRVEKKVSTFNGSIWIEQLRERTLYDGWNPIGTWRLQPPDAGHSNPWWKLHHHYVWGPDVSGTEQGAGGVGGLAMIIGGIGGNWFPCYDGNGNITALVDAQPNGALAAQYDYDAFGNPTRMSGPAAKLNPFRFSTKFTDNETELVYYGYRYYDPGMGRWLGRDPIGEKGGVNIYQFVHNTPTTIIDLLGKKFGDNTGDPAITDNFGLANPTKQMAYFERQYPGWLAHIKQEAESRAHSVMDAFCCRCENVTIKNIVKETLLPYGPAPLWGRDRKGPWNEDIYGDNCQNYFDHHARLGAFNWVADAEVYAQCGIVIISIEVRAEDRLGVSADDFEAGWISSFMAGSAIFWAGAKVEQTVTRASWGIYLSKYCDSCPGGTCDSMSSLDPIDWENGFSKELISRRNSQLKRDQIKKFGHAPFNPLGSR